ncbi:MAG: 2,3-bisphosphoglycerate-independent phosphoglycerate mutase [Candidatus Eisenbacteria bacterium]|nr:2,3-bisphosphoglycerate-independent phosphoglycerate mutase [Candidatus Eisenbacteria bacterium]
MREGTIDWTLKRIAGVEPPRGPLLLIVMDGIGVGRGDEGDAVAAARTPNLDALRGGFPWRTLRAHGTAVGLPDDGDMGNSEVGHNALGAGRVYDQGAKLVNRAIADGSLFSGAVWKEIVERCRTRGSALHLIGLLSDGNVHSHIDQLFALIREAARSGLHEVYVHILLDGRDVPETSALTYVDRLEALLATYDDTPGFRYRIASGGGRMVTTMDRYEADWRIVQRGWEAHVHGNARGFPSAREAIETYRAETPGIIDQFLPPFVVTGPDGKPVATIDDGDCVVFFNFRGDRAIEISRAFEQEEFRHFDRGRRPGVLYAGMMQYDGDFEIPKRFLVSPPAIDRTMGEYLARNGIAQLACSETQKYGHVTYFWNGNRGGKFDDAKETYIEVPSDRVPFEQRPWMKAAEIVDTVAAEMEKGLYRFARLNFANGDMVGHTGVFEPTVVAVESVDLCLGRLLAAIARLDGVAVVTADHGNADDMCERDKKGTIERDPSTGRPKPRTSHSLNPVPFAIYAPGPAGPSRYRLRQDLPAAGLANVAATLLQILGYEAPEGYEPSLLA